MSRPTGAKSASSGASKSTPALKANPALTHNSLDAFRKLQRGLLEPVPPQGKDKSGSDRGDAGPPEVLAAATPSPSLPSASPPATRTDRAEDVEPGAGRAGSAPPRPESTASTSGRPTTTASTRRAASHKRTKDHDDRGVHFQSFLDEVPVEACLEYLTRPHTSWDSAVNTIRQRLDRIDELNATVRSRSFGFSRADSFASADSLNTTMHSVASAPAGFPRSASNSSRTKTGTLRRGRLGTAGTTSGSAGGTVARPATGSPPPPDLTITGESTTADVLGITTTSAISATPLDATARRARSSGQPTRSPASRSGTVTPTATPASAHAPRGGQLIRGSVAHRLGAPAAASRDGVAGDGTSPSTRLGTGRSAKAPSAPPRAKKPQKGQPLAGPSTGGLDLCIGPSR